MSDSNEPVGSGTRELIKTVIVSLLISATTTCGVGWGMLQRHDERLATLEHAEDVRRSADESRDAKIDQLQVLLIRVDERMVSMDSRLQRMETSLDRQRP